MHDFDRSFPPPLAALHARMLELMRARDEADDDDDPDADEPIDFEPYEEFMSAADNRSWIHAWTGNTSLSGDHLRIFGQDGTGGLAAIWLAGPNADPLASPVVFFGSEGELAVLAADFSDYLWLLAGGFGPCEATWGPQHARQPSEPFAAFAREHATGPRRTPPKILERARTAFPNFETTVRAWSS